MLRLTLLPSKWANLKPMTDGTKVYTGYFYIFLWLISEREHIANRTGGGFLHIRMPGVRVMSLHRQCAIQTEPVT
jgi:hypothetical protein